MPSKISCFNQAVFRRNLTRFAPLWIGYLALWIVVLPLPILTQGANSYYDLSSLQQQVFNAGLTGGCIITGLFAIAAAMALFSWTYQSRSVNTMAALPIRRETLFLTNMLTALVILLVTHVLVALMSLGAAAAVGFSAAGLTVRWFFLTTLQFLFFFGLATLCAVLVGQIVALPVLYILLNFTAVVLNYVTVTVLSTFVYGMRDGGYTLLARYSPAFYMLNNLHTSGHSVLENGETIWHYSFHRWDYLLVIAAVGVVLAGAAFFLFRRRRMEAAGDVIAIRPLRPVFKYCFTVGCSLVLGVLAAALFFSGSASPRLWVITLCLLTGGFVGYFAAEILLQKSFHVFRREWIGFGVFAACLLCCIALMEFDVFGFERRVPDAADVESITIEGAAVRNRAIVTEETYIADLITLHQNIVRNKAEQEALARRWDSDSDTLDYSYINLVYQLKNGKTLSRAYRIYSTEQMWLDPAGLPRQFAEICNDPHIVLLGNMPDFDVSAASVSYSYISYYEPKRDTWESKALTGEQAYELYTDALLPDMQDGLLGGTPMYRFNDTSETNYAADVYIEFTHTVDGPEQTGDRVVLDSYYLDLTPTVGSRTEGYLKDFDIPLMLQSDYQAIAELQSAIAGK